MLPTILIIIGAVALLAIAFAMPSPPPDAHTSATQKDDDRSDDAEEISDDRRIVEEELIEVLVDEVSVAEVEQEDEMEFDQPVEISQDRPVQREITRAALAVVVDDCGFNFPLAERLAAKKFNFTWAIIPNKAYSEKTADLLIANDIPFLVHIPMQAIGDAPKRWGTDGSYAVGSGMTEADIRRLVLPMIDSLPGHYGLNNHRGSVATADAKLMRSLMKILAERSEFFLDSSTTRHTVANKIAKEHGVTTLKNNYFLDNISDREKIREAFETAIAMAKKNRSLIAICHLRPETIAFLESIDERFFTERGVDLVSIPEMVELRRGLGL